MLDVKRKVAVRSNRELTAPLLCGECERRIKRYDDAASYAALQRGGDFPLIDSTRLGGPTGGSQLVYAGLRDSEGVLKFAYSLFWRAAEYNKAVDERQRVPVDMGAWQEPVRCYLLEKGPEPREAAVMLQAFHFPKMSVLNCTDHVPRVSRPRGTSFHVNICLIHGVEFSLFLGSGIPFGDGVVFRDPTWTFLLRPFEEWAYFDKLGDAIMASREIGKVWTYPPGAFV